jgi:hypothetical protein
VSGIGQGIRRARVPLDEARPTSCEEPPLLTCEEPSQEDRNFATPSCGVLRLAAHDVQVLNASSRRAPGHVLALAESMPSRLGEGRDSHLAERGVVSAERGFSGLSSSPPDPRVRKCGMQESIGECRGEDGQYTKPEQCPYNPAPSAAWRRIVDGWEWHQPGDPNDLAWKSGPCPRCGNTMTVEVAGPGAGEAVAGTLSANVLKYLEETARLASSLESFADEVEGVLAYCNCGLAHSGRNDMPGCGPAAYMTPPSGSAAQS